MKKLDVLGTRCTLLRPGIVAYADALALQHETAARVHAGGTDTLILIQHPPTYTLGARGREDHFLVSEAALRTSGAEVVRTDRGGDVTFHGPGQIVAYPIVNIRARGMGPVAYVRALEQVMIDTLALHGIEAERVCGRPGVWSGNAKVGAIGVRVSRGVTTHGFALNVTTDLDYFARIVPCGITDAGVTSMERLARWPFAINEIEDEVVAAFARVFDMSVEAPQSEATEAALGASVGR